MSALAVVEAEPNDLLAQIAAARRELDRASLDSLIAMRAWADAITKAAKEKALRETALEASEMRCRAERALGEKLRSGAGRDLPISDRAALVEVAEIPIALFDDVLADMRRTRQGDQILQFRPDAVLRRAVKLSAREVEPGISADYRGRFNGFDTVAEARRAAADARAEAARWRAYTEEWEVKEARKKPSNVKLDEAFSRARRLAQSVSSMTCNSPEAREELARAEALLGEAAAHLHRACQLSSIFDASIA